MIEVDQDVFFMKKAIAQAKKGAGLVAPNPLVGAVVVKDGVVIGKGFHRVFGGMHAERNAIQSCKADTKGATLYVTLEPCCHYGKTPPCTQAIIEAGIRRVVVGCKDPNPLVSGKGIKLLGMADIEVLIGICKEECEEVARFFLSYMRTGRPYVTMKYAMTADGKTASYTGDSKWITGETARKYVHMMRKEHAAVMAGIGTVLADDPMLNYRGTNSEAQQPVRIVCDGNLRIPLHSRLVCSAEEIPVLVVTLSEDMEKERQLVKKGVRILHGKKKNGKIDLGALMDTLGEKGINSIFLEGGGSLNYSALEAGIVCRIQTFVAPKIIGGAKAKTPVDGVGIAKIAEGHYLKIRSVKQLGQDVFLEYDVKQERRENVYRDCRTGWKN